MESRMTRRPIAARNTRMAAATAKWLADAGLKPNTISVLSVLFAALAAAGLFLLPAAGGRLGGTLLCLGAACAIPLRLLCNMFDGMVAVEGGHQTRVGDLYNELPDRISDVLVLVGAGYSTAHPAGILLGWVSAVLAVLTAYIRTLGGVAGALQPFCGPMAKQQRMVAVIVGCLLTAAELMAGRTRLAMMLMLGVIAVGSVLTCIRRTWLIAKSLNAK